MIMHMRVVVFGKSTFRLRKKSYWLNKLEEKEIEPKI